MPASFSKIVLPRQFLKWWGETTVTHLLPKEATPALHPPTRAQWPLQGQATSRSQPSPSNRATKEMLLLPLLLCLDRASPPQSEGGAQPCPSGVFWHKVQKRFKYFFFSMQVISYRNPVYWWAFFLILCVWLWLRQIGNLFWLFNNVGLVRAGVTWRRESPASCPLRFPCPCSDVSRYFPGFCRYMLMPNCVLLQNVSKPQHIVIPDVASLALY